MMGELTENLVVPAFTILNHSPKSHLLPRVVVSRNRINISGFVINGRRFLVVVAVREGTNKVSLIAWYY